MSEAGVAQKRWQLPARRKRFMVIAVPIVFLVMLVGFGSFGDWLEGLGLAVSFAGLTLMLSVVTVRLEPDTGTPDPPRISMTRAERRRIRTVVQHRLAIDEEERERLRPLVEQLGRGSARGVWAAGGVIAYMAGSSLSSFGEGLELTTPVRLIVIVAGLIGLALMSRDLRVCRQFMERY